jgi:hypothetical protein
MDEPAGPIRRPLGLAKIPAALTRTVYVVAAIFFVIAAVVHVLTYTPLGSADAVQTATFVLFPCAFPVFGAVVIIVAFNRLRLDLLMGSLPFAIKVLGVLLLAYIFVDFLSMFKLLVGQPTEQAGKFFLNDHGTLIPVSLDGYRQGLAYQARLFTGHEMFFFGWSAVIGYQIDRLRSGRLRLAAPTIPEAISDSPSPISLVRSVVLETSYSPNQCASQLQASVDRIPAAFLGSSSKLWGTISAEGFWLQLAQGSASQLAFAVGRFAQQGTGTRVQLQLRLKRWVLLAVAGTALVLVILGVVFDNARDHRFVILFSAMGAFGLLANVAFALAQRHRLLSTIEHALNARRGQM